jgi:hypothetical protein
LRRRHLPNYCGKDLLLLLNCFFGAGAAGERVIIDLVRDWIVTPA